MRQAMARRSVECVALATVLVLMACGGGGKGAEGGTAGTPTSAPAPSPGPSPSPSPGPAPSPSPSPAPTPAPAPAPARPQVLRGAVLYRDHCASCHGDDPENGTQGIYKALTAEVIEAAYRRVELMRLIDAVLSAEQDADIAAFIESRVRPL